MWCGAVWCGVWCGVAWSGVVHLLAELTQYLRVIRHVVDALHCHLAYRRFADALTKLTRWLSMAHGGTVDLRREDRDFLDIS